MARKVRHRSDNLLHVRPRIGQIQQSIKVVHPCEGFGQSGAGRGNCPRGLRTNNHSRCPRGATNPKRGQKKKVHKSKSRTSHTPQIVNTGSNCVPLFRLAGWRLTWLALPLGPAVGRAAFVPPLFLLHLLGLPFYCYQQPASVRSAIPPIAAIVTLLLVPPGSF